MYMHPSVTFRMLARWSRKWKVKERRYKNIAQLQGLKLRQMNIDIVDLPQKERNFADLC